MKLRKTKWIGTLGFFVSLPGLYLYLRLEERTRVVIRVDNEVLVLKGWYGSNRWMLPGGGVHKGEDVTQAAIREVYEETGIKLQLSDLFHISSGHRWDTYGLRYVCHMFGVDLNNKPKLNLQATEIFQSAWLPEKLVQADTRNTLRVSREAVAAWSASQNLV